MCAPPYRRFTWHRAEWPRDFFPFSYIDSVDFSESNFDLCASIDPLKFLSLSDSLYPFIAHTHLIKSTTLSWSVALFILKCLHTVDTCFFFFLPHTQTLSAPQHLVPGAPESVLVIPPGSPFHFASLYLSHITLKIEGKWARRCDERKRVSLLGLSLDLCSTHTHTLVQLTSS